MGIWINPISAFDIDQPRSKYHYLDQDKILLQLIFYLTIHVNLISVKFQII